MSKKPLYNKRGHVRVNYYDIDSLIEDLSIFCETGHIDAIDYHALRDIHDRDLSLETIVENIKTIPSVKTIISKHFPEDSDSCL